MLEIKKLGSKNFFHYWVTPSKTFEYSASDLDLIYSNSKVFLRSISKAVIFKKEGFSISEIKVYDVGGSAEVFTDYEALQQRLIELGHPAYDISYIDVQAEVDAFQGEIDAKTDKGGYTGTSQDLADSISASANGVLQFATKSEAIAYYVSNTPDDYTRFDVRNDESNNGEYVFLAGATDDIDFQQPFLGELLLKTSDQLFNNAILQNRGLELPGSIGGVSNNYLGTPYFEIQPNTTYTLSGIGGVSASLSRYAFKDNLDAVISVTNGLGLTNNDDITFTTPSNAVTMAFNVSSASGSGLDFINGVSEYPNTVMLNLGTVAFPFAIYGQIFDKEKAGFPTLYDRLYISTTGTDEGLGTLEDPTTFTGAKGRLEPNGEIVLLEGDYENPLFELDAFKNVRAEQGAKVRFIYGEKLTSATLEGGYTRVYKTTFTSDITANSFIWQHDIEDEATLIPTNEMHPLHFGRTHRLSSTRIYPATSIAEIESTTDKLMWFKDGSDLYFSKVDGSDLALNPIRIPKVSTIRQYNDWELNLSNIRFMYCSLYLQGLRGKWYNVRAGMTKFAGAIIADDSEIVFDSCEAEACLNDGFNTHNTNTVTDDFTRQILVRFINCYSHDNSDDGESCHDYCESHHDGGLYEYNGNGVTPASGGHSVCNNVMTRKNGVHDWTTDQVGTGFSSQGTSQDGGTSSNIICNNCLSIEDKTSFKGYDNASMFINCISKDAIVTDFNGGQNINGTTI